MYPGYRETTRVVPGQSVTIGDEDYAVRLVDFLPDFQMDASGHAFSRSDSSANPALKVAVLKAGKEVAVEWAFEGDGPPHFRQTSLFGFRIQELHLKEQAEGAAEGKQDP
jgi:hypothetical protein